MKVMTRDEIIEQLPREVDYDDKVLEGTPQIIIIEEDHDE